jgi:hypothetical protein
MTEEPEHRSIHLSASRLRVTSYLGGAPRGIRTPNRQIRRLVLYVHPVRLSAVCAAQVRCRIQPGRLSPVWCWLVD